MKIKVNGKALADAVDTLRGALAKKSTIEALGCVLLTADAEGLRLYATDLDQFVTVRLPAEVIEPGEVAPNGLKFCSIARELGRDELVSLTSDGTGLKVTAKGSRFSMQGVAPTEMPSPVEFEVLSTVKMRSAFLAAAYDRTGFATRAEGDVMSGLRVTFAPEAAQFVGTDGHRLSVVDVPVEQGPDVPGTVLLPALSLKAHLGTLKKAETLDLRIGKGLLAVTVGNAEIVLRLMEGTFPKIETILGKIQEHPKTAQVDGTALAAALRRALLMADESPYTVVFTLTPGSMSLSTPAGGSEVDLPCEYDGEETRIGLNGHYIAQWLTAVAGGPITLRLKDDRAAALFSMTGGGTEYVVMPISLPPAGVAPAPEAPAA